ncbi:MAG: citramalate synthase [Planctomycetes bacterium]|nr:citramalate synthase [Planctomycetota bacterium]
MKKITIYDTTLRDGSQGEGISFSLDDKLKILRCLDEFKIDYVEGGWPGSNPKDVAFFNAARGEKLQHARLAAFGSTRRPGTRPQEDANLKALIAVETPVVTIFGKSWKLHVTEVFRTTLEENLNMIESSVAYLRSHGREAIYDAEHFFDGYKSDPDYALATLDAAVRGGADCLVLCDTNGGTLTTEIEEIVAKVLERFRDIPIGIHTHNDGGLAVANSLAAVSRGATHVQGTVNGLGERCGNADLIPIIPNLILKMGCALSIDRDTLRSLTHVARYVSAVANHNFPESHPYVGRMAFAHKGGVHVNSVMKVTQTYEHLDPELVGNSRRILISELSGKSNIKYLAEEQEIDLENNQEAIQRALNEIKQHENQGFVYEGAEASSTLIILKALGKLPELFDLVNYRAVVDHRVSGGTLSEATVKICVKGEEHLAAGEGNGPVDALDAALRNAIKRFFPEVETVRLSDYKVRVIDADEGTHAKVRVMIESSDAESGEAWGTVGASENIIEASWLALRDAIVYGILRKRQRATA